jgi:hypothetical protein
MIHKDIYLPEWGLIPTRMGPYAYQNGALCLPEWGNYACIHLPEWGHIPTFFKHGSQMSTIPVHLGHRL